MALEQHQVRLIGHPNEASTGLFLFDNEEYGATYRLVLRFAQGEIVAVAPDYFEALCHIREQLAERGLRPVCFGSSRNVYPSGMGRDMGRGLKAYRMHLGQQPRLEDLVMIFDTDATVEPVSVAEQRAFVDEWMKSRGIWPR